MRDYRNFRRTKSGWLPIAGAAAALIVGFIVFALPGAAWSQGGISDRLRSFFPGQKPPPPPRLVMVFVDISGSIPQEDWDIYEKTYSTLVGPPEGREDKAALKVGAQGKAGDKLILGTISEGTLINFSPVADGELKDTGRLVVDRNNNEEVLNNLRAGFPKIKKMKSARHTQILDAFSLSQQLIEQNKDRSYVIVILSDMLEESALANFEKKAPTAADTEAIIKRQRASKLLPDLHGAKVYVAGAKAPNSTHFAAVQAFWARYLNEANAIVEAGTYGRSPIDFAEAWRQR
jgi:hypothetical protein